MHHGYIAERAGRRCHASWPRWRGWAQRAAARSPQAQQKNVYDVAPVSAVRR